MESLIETSIYRSRLLDSVEKVINCYKPQIFYNIWHNFEANISVIRHTASYYILYLGMIDIELNLLPLFQLTNTDYNEIISCFDYIIISLTPDQDGKYNSK